MSSSRRKPGFTLKKAPVEKKPTRVARHAASKRAAEVKPVTTPKGRGKGAASVPSFVKQRGPSPIPKGELYPMRINKYLALKGHSTRREADTLVSRKAVLINGRVAQVGDKVLESDAIEVRRNSRPKQYAYFAFNKPAGVDTHQEDTGAENIFDSLPAELKQLRLFPIGRLDKASHGLIILTNDGRITDRLLNPEYEHEKVYEVRTKQPIRATFKDHMEKGVLIE